MKIRDFISYFESRFPKDTAMDGDVVGLQIGNLDAKINGIIIGLEINDEIIELAINQNANLIFVHHAFIYHPINQITFDTVMGKRIKKLIEHNINVYNAHTNLDIGVDGINDNLCDYFGIENTMTFADNDGYHFMRVGTIKKQSLAEYARWIQTKVDTPIRIVGNKDQLIEVVGIVGGNGSYDIEGAHQAGCDLFLTGDIKYSQALFARDRGLSLIDIGHNAEKFFVPYLAKQFRDYMNSKNLDIKIYEYLNPDVFQTL